MFKIGDIAFFRKAKRDCGRKTPEGTFKGHGFGLFLGHVPPFAKEPPKVFIHRTLGTLGFLSFDDVTEFISEEAAAECVKKFEDKYYGPVVRTEAEAQKLLDTAATDLVVPEEKKILGLDGNPFPPVKE